MITKPKQLELILKDVFLGPYSNLEYPLPDTEQYNQGKYIAHILVPKKGSAGTRILETIDHFAKGCKKPKTFNLREGAEFISGNVKHAVFDGDDPVQADAKPLFCRPGYYYFIAKCGPTAKAPSKKPDLIDRDKSPLESGVLVAGSGINIGLWAYVPEKREGNRLSFSFNVVQRNGSSVSGFGRMLDKFDELADDDDDDDDDLDTESLM